MAEAAVNNFPAPPAAPPLFGLIASLGVEKNTGRTGPDGVVVPNWYSGITYAPEGCVDGDTLPLYWNVNNQKTPTDRPDSVSWLPYTLSVYEQCSTFSGWEENAARARRSLLADTERQLAAELWGGAIANAGGAGYPNTWLANAPLTLDGTIVPALQGLYCLDAYLAHNNSGQQGAIHAPVEIFDTWKSLQAIYMENGKWYSPIGNLVITSPGYPGTPPDDSAYAAGLWAYATDLPRVFLGDIKPPVEIKNQVDRSNNTIAVLAERVALVEWQRCRHAAVPMDIDVCDLV